MTLSIAIFFSNYFSSSPQCLSLLGIQRPFFKKLLTVKQLSFSDSSSYIALIFEKFKHLQKFV